MARIRTIKPEFPQSESMGRVSRDARLCFIELWTIADDSGRLRGNSRMLSSLLFPYDDDAPWLIDGWLQELERESCIVRYTHENQSYIQVANWLDHQKIDKPSPSKFPEFARIREDSPNAREDSSEDQGPRTKEEDQGARSAREAEPVDNSPEPTVPQVATACLPAGYKTRIQEAVALSSSRISTAEYEDISQRLFTLYPNADSAASFVAYVLERSQGKDVRNSGAMIRSALLGRPGFELWPEDYEASKRERRSETHREPTPLAPVPPACYCGGALKVNRQLGQGQCVECGTFWEWDATLKEWIVSEAVAVEA